MLSTLVYRLTTLVIKFSMTLEWLLSFSSTICFGPKAGEGLWLGPSENCRGWSGFSSVSFWRFRAGSSKFSEEPSLLLLRPGILAGMKGDMMNSSPLGLTTNLSYRWASSHILSSEAYCVLVSRYYLWSSPCYFKCRTFCLQLSICQHLMQSTSLLLFYLICVNLLMNTFH